MNLKEPLTVDIIKELQITYNSVLKSGQEMSNLFLQSEKNILLGILKAYNLYSIEKD